MLPASNSGRFGSVSISAQAADCVSAISSTSSLSRFVSSCWQSNGSLYLTSSAESGVREPLGFGETGYFDRGKEPSLFTGASFSPGSLYSGGMSDLEMYWNRGLLCGTSLLETA